MAAPAPPAPPRVFKYDAVQRLSQVAPIWVLINTFDCREYFPGSLRVLEAARLTELYASKALSRSTMLAGLVHEARPLLSSLSHISAAFFRPLEFALELNEAGGLYKPITPKDLQSGLPPPDWCLPLHMQLHQQASLEAVPEAAAPQPTQEYGTLQALATAALGTCQYWCLVHKFHEDQAKCDFSWRPTDLVVGLVSKAVSPYTLVIGLNVVKDRSLPWMRPSLFVPIAAILHQQQAGIAYNAVSRNDLVVFNVLGFKAALQSTLATGSVPFVPENTPGAHGMGGMDMSSASGEHMSLPINADMGPVRAALPLGRPESGSAFALNTALSSSGPFAGPLSPLGGAAAVAPPPPPPPSAPPSASQLTGLPLMRTLSGQAQSKGASSTSSSEPSAGGAIALGGQGSMLALGGVPGLPQATIQIARPKPVDTFARPAMLNFPPALPAAHPHPMPGASAGVGRPGPFGSTAQGHSAMPLQLGGIRPAMQQVGLAGLDMSPIASNTVRPTSSVHDNNSTGKPVSVLKLGGDGGMHVESQAKLGDPSTTDTAWKSSLFRLFSATQDSATTMTQPAAHWWHLDSGRSVQGPFSVEQMIVSYVRGTLNDTSLVCGSEFSVMQAGLSPTVTFFEPLGTLLAAMQGGSSSYSLVTCDEVKVANSTRVRPLEMSGMPLGGTTAAGPFAGQRPAHVRPASLGVAATPGRALADLPTAPLSSPPVVGGANGGAAAALMAPLQAGVSKAIQGSTDSK